MEQSVWSYSKLHRINHRFRNTFPMRDNMYFLSFEWNELDRKYALVGMLVCACAYMGGAVCYLWYLTVCACVVRQF